MITIITIMKHVWNGQIICNERTFFICIPANLFWFLWILFIIKCLQKGHKSGEKKSEEKNVELFFVKVKMQLKSNFSVILTDRMYVLKMTYCQKKFILNEKSNFRFVIYFLFLMRTIQRSLLN